MIDVPNASSYWTYVTIYGDYVAVRVPDYDGKTGIVYVYKISNEGYIRIIQPSDSLAMPGFGSSIESDGDNLVIGSFTWNGWPGKAYIYSYRVFN